MKKAKKIHGVAKAPIMIKLAEALDEATGNAIEVYQLLQDDGTYVTIEVGREIACDLAAFRRELNKKVSLLPRDREGAKPIIAAATMMPPKEQRLYAAQLGWRELKQLVTVNGGDRRQHRPDQAYAAAEPDAETAQSVEKGGDIEGMEEDDQTGEILRLRAFFAGGRIRCSPAPVHGHAVLRRVYLRNKQGRQIDSVASRKFDNRHRPGK
jgi:hypothetical protein